MKIRPATKHDALQIKSLINELGYDTPIDEITSQIEIYTERKESYTFVAEVDHSLKGLIAAYVNPYFHKSGYILRIVAFIVAAEGRRDGIGTALYEAIEKIAYEWECDRIEVTAAAHRADEAHKFYRNVGFFSYDGVRFLKNTV